MGIGFKPKKVPFIPYSGFNGDNLVVKSDKASWYKGWTANKTPKVKVTGFTLVEALDKLFAEPSNKELFVLEMPSELLQLVLRERKCSPLNNTRRFWTLPDQETLSVCPSRVSPR